MILLLFARIALIGFYNDDASIGAVTARLGEIVTARPRGMVPASLRGSNFSCHITTGGPLSDCSSC